MLDVPDSTNLAAIGYDKSHRILRARFHDGSEYQYERVEPAAFLALTQASSIGSHFAAEIKGHYKTWRIRRARKGAHAS